MVEGRDHPEERPKDPIVKKYGKTVALLLTMCKPLYSTGKVVILDSGFCVLRGIVELRKKGVFAGALIKKRRYWPKYIDGEKIDSYFADRDV